MILGVLRVSTAAKETEAPMDQHQLQTLTVCTKIRPELGYVLQALEKNRIGMAVRGLSDQKLKAWGSMLAVKLLYQYEFAKGLDSFQHHP